MSHISLTYHIVWRTKYSRPTIDELHERDLYLYINGICKAKKCKIFRLNSMPDHIHLGIEIPPCLALRDFMKILKQETSKWIKEHREWFPMFDSWGNGYAAFTYSVQERPMVIEYIKNQKEHHKHITFREEYDAWLTEMGIDPKEDLFFKDD